jgi:uncharacterized protein YcbK (DUF882 family)
VPFGSARPKPLICNSSRAGRGLGLSALLLVLGTSGLQNAAADSDTRTLKIHHTHTKEDITVTFKRNGRYDDGGLERLNRILRDWRNDEQIKMDPQLFDIVWEVYQEAGGKEPIQIISAYRSPATNSMLRRRSRGVAQFSQHMLGKAIDFNIPDVPLDRVRAAGLRQQRGGVGFYPSSQFVHLDVGSVRHWPRMTHDQLVRVFPNGRTVHVPSDGRPLPGYELALADIERRGGSPSRVSLAYARDAGVIGADGSVPGAKPKRSLLARLFGIGEEDEDANEIAATRKPAVAARGKAAEEPKPAQTASLVPLPRVRPLAREPKPELGGMRVTASSPADIVVARGPWPGRTMQAAAAPDPARPVERLVWQTGPQGRPIASSVGGRTVIEGAVPRSLPIELVSVGGPPASLPSGPIGAREDRIPSESMLAFAPQPAAIASDQPARAAPMGALRPGQSAVARTPAPTGAQAAAQLPSSKPLRENPWLRGLIVAPSIQDSMDVVATSGADYRAIAPLMRKPAMAVAAAFSDDPAFEATEPQMFGGRRAVDFLPTVTFGRVTASLR